MYIQKWTFVGFAFMYVIRSHCCFCDSLGSYIICYHRTCWSRANAQALHSGGLSSNFIQDFVANAGIVHRLGHDFFKILSNLSLVDQTNQCYIVLILKASLVTNRIDLASIEDLLNSQIIIS
jgi:hypothetical protein